MSISTAVRTIARAALGTVVAGGLLLGMTPAASAAPVGAVEVTPVAAVSAACQDASSSVYGHARDGLLTLEGRRPYYEYGNSPWIAVRWRVCPDTVTVYYGGYEGITHYNVRWIGGSGYEQQVERPGRDGNIVISAADLPTVTGFTVQACTRGGFLQGSSCTRWSPLVLLDQS